jgi:Fe-Mn family superoxide dismutase
MHRICILSSLEIEAIMKKRTFIKVSGIVAAGAIINPLMSCSSDKKEKKGTKEVFPASSITFELPELPYGFDALEPYIDTQTMQIHHGKHHAGYVRKFNAALAADNVRDAKLTGILKNIKAEDTALRNNGGGHFNHSLFWKIMKPGGSKLADGDLSDAIKASFGDMKGFQESFSKVAKTRFGSGWAWLSIDDKDKLYIQSTPNQDNPLMKGIVEKNGRPILGLDVWEHAYYLKYQNRRGDYINNFFNIINWNEVTTLFKNYLG